MSWEYKVVEFNVKQRSFLSHKVDTHHIESQLNDLGRMGWELVQFTPPNMSSFMAKTFSAVLKRRK